MNIFQPHNIHTYCGYGYGFFADGFIQMFSLDLAFGMW